MPYVSVRITKDGATPEQKAEVIRRVTQVLV
jgi:4-oxalocrotonate tautomerase family enzyme